MPMYEYYCSTCRTRFERLVRSPDEGASAPCPTCGRDRVPRVLSTFAAVRRGGDGAELSAAARGGCCGAGGCGCGA
jgi:putative FmdB family regulatory protein